MTTKDIWRTLNEAQKLAHIRDSLDQLSAIESNTHAISGKHSQGRLAKIKTDLETFLLNTVNWEVNNNQKFK